MSSFSTSFSGGFETPRRGNSGAFSLKSKNGWASPSSLSGVAQVALGLVIFATSSLYLMHGIKFSGQLIGAASIVLGLVGILGLRFRNASMQLLFVVGLGFIAMMTFEFTVQVGRDVNIHCSFVEVYTRLTHLEEKMMSMRQNEMVMQLFSRLNEMDDMLDMVQDGTIEDLDFTSREQQLMEQDLHFIQTKILHLRQHADRVLEHLVAEGEKADAAVQSVADPKLKQKQKDIQAALQNHLENVEKVMAVLDQKSEKNEGVTYEEYEQLFHALLGSHAKSEELNQEKGHLPFLKAAWDRYTTGYPPDLTDKAQALARHREEQRHLFEQTFHLTMDANQQTGFHATLAESLEDLPEHCMMENAHLPYFVYGGWILIAAQLATAYVTTTALFLSNSRKDI